MTQAVAAAPSPVRIIWSSRFFRSATLSLLMSGLGVSAALPQLTLFFTTELGASPTVAGFYYLTNAAAPVVGYVIGRRSDRGSDRLSLFRFCSVVGALGYVAMALSTQIWMPFVISIVALSIGGATGAQVFAAVRDELSRRPTGADNRVLATIRMAYTGGFILGPVVGSVVGGMVGLRWLLIGTAALVLGQQLPLARVRVARFIAPVVEGAPAVDRSARAMLPLIIFSALCVLALAGDTAKIAYLPIYMDQVLQTPDAVRGAVMSTQPLLELALIPVFGYWADRVDPVKLMTLGAAFAAAANLTYALSDHVAGLFLGQVLMSGLWGAMAGLGVNVAQSLYPQGVGVASGVFLSSTTFSVAFGGALGGFGVAALGLPHVFFVPFTLACVAVLGMAALALHRHRTRPPPVSTKESTP